MIISYGDDTHRPHYHLIFLGCPQDRKLIYDTWNYGNIDVGNIDNGAIRYVLDYINKDPIFPDSKYELYGDFEPPFYHFSKGLGFEEIEKLINQGFFNEYGQGQWTDKHKYILPPYLMQKYGFKSKPDFYTDSQVKWAEEKGFNNLELATINRSQVVERTLIAAKVARSGVKLDLGKAERNEMLDRQNRFIGFQDYQELDLLLGLK